MVRALAVRESMVTRRVTTIQKVTSRRRGASGKENHPPEAMTIAVATAATDGMLACYHHALTNDSSR